MDLTKTGVYSITNTVNGKQYIGSAARSFKYRFDRHLQKLRTDKHHCLPLQRAWNKYGEEAFKFEILAICPPSFCLAGEQFYLNAWKPEYNVCKVAGSRLGIKATEEQKEKYSKRMKKHFDITTEEGRVNRELMSKKQKERYSDPDLIEKVRQKSIEQFASLEAREMLSKRAKDFFSNPEAVEIARQNSIKQFSDPAQREKNREAKSLFEYTILTPSGDIHTTTSAKKYAADNNLDAGRLLRTLVGTRACGRKCTHEKGYKVLSKTPRQK